MHRERLRSNSPTVYLVCEKPRDREGQDRPAIWAAVSESNADRSRAPYNTANQIIKYETQELRPFLILLFVCNQARKPQTPKDPRPSEAFPNSSILGTLNKGYSKTNKKKINILDYKAYHQINNAQLILHQQELRGKCGL